MHTNDDRIRAAQVAVDAHRDAIQDYGSTEDQRVIDILTNLRHLCHRKGLDFATASRTSLTHFQDEINQ